MDGLDSQLTRFGSDAASAEKLISFGEFKRDAAISAVDLAAYTTVAGVILNLDETITKE